MPLFVKVLYEKRVICLALGYLALNALVPKVKRKGELWKYDKDKD